MIQLPSDRVLGRCHGVQRDQDVDVVVCHLHQGAVLVIQRPYSGAPPVILIGAIPIAIVSNVARIVTAAILLELVGPSAEEVFHVHRARPGYGGPGHAVVVGRDVVDVRRFSWRDPRRQP